MLMKNTYLETLFQHVETVTTEQIILGDNDDIDALCPANNSP